MRDDADEDVREAAFEPELRGTGAAQEGGRGGRWGAGPSAAGKRQALTETFRSVLGGTPGSLGKRGIHRPPSGCTHTPRPKRGAGGTLLCPGTGNGVGAGYPALAARWWWGGEV